MTGSAGTTPLTARVQRLRERCEEGMLGADGSRVARLVFSLEEFLEKEQIRLDSYRRTAGQPAAWQRVRAFLDACSGLAPQIAEDELIVGSQRGNLYLGPGVGGPSLSHDEQARLDHLSAAQASVGIAFGEGHVVCDHGRVLREGLRGVVDRIAELRGRVAVNDPRREVWDQMLVACEATRQYALRHAQTAREQALSYRGLRGRELRAIADVCERVPWEPARTFHEAVQSLWFQHVLLHIESPSVAYSPGRIDQLLWPYLSADLEADRITTGEARELLACLWLKMWEGDESQNVTIGGVDEAGRDVTNPLSYWVLELTSELAAFQPSVSVRLGEQSPERLWHAAAELARRGLGQPSLFSEEVTRRALGSVGVPDADVWNWAIVGCYEAVVQGAEWGRTVACGVYLPHCVLAALNTAPADWETLLARTQAELCAGIARATDQANATEAYLASHAASAFQSLLMRDCVERGMDLYNGGARHNYSACWLGGLATGVDSLLAARSAVYGEGAELSLGALLALLEADFADAEAQRQALLAAPKFGNGDGAADAVATELCAFFCDEVVRHRNRRGGIFQPSLAMYQQHYAGLSTGATPDGRRAGTPFSAGIAPSQGCNLRGVTATLGSCAGLPHDRAPNGNFLMLSMQPELVAGEVGLERLVQLFQTYLGEGGSHLMLNVVGAETLRDAMAHPERHRDLMVRVSGLSAHFVVLPRHIQEDLVTRAESGL